MRLGAHMSISGGVEKAVVRGQEVGCEAMQIFTKNSNQWKAKPLTPAEITAFRDACEAAAIAPVIAHSAYLINLAAPDDAAGLHAAIALEVTAGQGTALAYKFEHFATLLEQVDAPERLGFCLDTCHLLAAGYDFRTRQGYDRMMAAWDDSVGIERIRVIHLNDSKKDLGSRVDRHEHIGQGYIGTKGFEFLLNDRRLAGLPMVLETPKDDNADVRNLQMLRSLMH